jgi:hypothetical protein
MNDGWKPWLDESLNKAKRKALRKRYDQSAKGKAKKARYRNSPKGQETEKRYRESLRGREVRKAALDRYYKTDKYKAKRARQRRSPKGRAAQQRHRENKRIRLFNLTDQEFAARCAAQDNRCPMCKVQTNLVRDHCEEMKTFRGATCSNCNTGLGYFQHNPAILESAITYLLAHRAV